MWNRETLYPNLNFFATPLPGVMSPEDLSSRAASTPRNESHSTESSVARSFVFNVHTRSPAVQLGLVPPSSPT